MAVLPLSSPDPECPDMGLSHRMASEGTYQRALGVTIGNRDPESY